MIKQLSSKIIYENKWMKLLEDEVEFPDGTKGTYAVAKRSDYSLIIPYENGHFYMVKQYRYPIKKESWEFPAGRTMGADLSPELVARNELEEETGLLAGTLKKIGFFYSSPASMTSGGHVYLATDFRPGKRHLDTSEVGMTVAKFSLNELEEMIRTGKICGAPTISAYGLLKVKGIV